MSSAPVVSVRGVYKTHRYGSSSVRALRGISLNVVRGEIACVVGPSGSGKTTLLNIIGGIGLSGLRLGRGGRRRGQQAPRQGPSPL